jgi:hypothetical protein
VLFRLRSESKSNPRVLTRHLPWLASPDTSSVLIPSIASNERTKLVCTAYEGIATWKAKLDYNNALEAGSQHDLPRVKPSGISNTCSLLKIKLCFSAVWSQLFKYRPSIFLWVNLRKVVLLVVLVYCLFKIDRDDTVFASNSVDVDDQR